MCIGAGVNKPPKVTSSSEVNEEPADDLKAPCQSLRHGLVVTESLRPLLPLSSCSCSLQEALWWILCLRGQLPLNCPLNNRETQTHLQNLEFNMDGWTDTIEGCTDWWMDRQGPLTALICNPRCLKITRANHNHMVPRCSIIVTPMFCLLHCTSQ